MILCCLLIPTSVGAMVRLYRSRVQEYWKNADQERYDISGLTSWSRLMWRGATLDRSPPPLLTYATGVEKSMQSRVRLGRHWADTSYVGTSAGNPLLATISNMDYAAVVRVVMSLLTILLLHDSIAGEKERGTLKVVLVTGVPRDVIILGKYIGGMAAAITPFVVGALLGLVVLVWTLPGEYSSEHVWRGFALSGVALLYVSAFGLLSLVVSSLCDRSSTALTALLLIWIVMVLVVPNASVLVARVAVKTKTEAELSGEVRTELDSARRQSWRLYRRWRHRRENRRLPWRERRKKLHEFREEAYKAASEKIQRLRREYYRGLQRQTGFAMDLSRVSPAAQFSYVAMQMARTDAERSNEDLEAADRYREAARDLIQDLVDLEESGDIWRRSREDVAAIDVDMLPAFKFGEEPIIESIHKSGIDFGLLCASNIILLMLAHVAFLRYSPV